MSDAEELGTYVDTWWSSVGDLLDLLEELEPADWDRPTDLAGWDVRAVAAHIAHLESLLAGGPEESADVPDAPHITGAMGQFTEVGVITRRAHAPEQIVTEIRRRTAERREQLLAEAPADGSAAAPGLFGAIGWNQRTLLRNRPLDVWMHEQDVRRAVGRPGNLDTPGAQHTADYLSDGFGFVIGKRVRPPAGTSAVLEVAGSAPVAVLVGDDGRARRMDEAPAAPTVRLAMDRETFIVLAGGRRAVEEGSVVATGDAALAEQIVGQLATTP